MNSSNKNVFKPLFFSLVLSTVWLKNVWLCCSGISAVVVGDVMFWSECSDDICGLCRRIHLHLTNLWPQCLLDFSPKAASDMRFKSLNECVLVVFTFGLRAKVIQSFYNMKCCVFKVIF